MKKVLFALVFLMGVGLLATSCTKDEIDDIEIFSPDKDTCPPGGCPDE
jgi:thioredoxin-related protein